MKRRTVFVLAAFALFLIVGGTLYVRKFRPDLLDRESVNAAELAALSNAPLAAPTPGAGWPQWLGPTRDGRAPAGPLRADWDKNPPRKLWEVPGGGGHSSFAVVDGKLYTQDKLGNEERVRCLDAVTGATLWEHREPVDYAGIDRNFANGPRATPAVVGSRVYAVGATGVLLALESPAAPGGTPKVVWRRDFRQLGAELPTWGFARSPVVDGDLVIVQPGAKSAMLAAFRQSDGEEVWKAGGDPDGYSSPTLATVGGVKQVVAVGGSKLVGVRADTGAALWEQPWATKYNGNIATPLVIDDYVFLSSSYSKGCGLFHLTPDAGGTRAEVVYFRPKRVMENHHANCVYRDGHLYGYDGETLRCVRVREGEQVPDWEGRDVDNKPIAKGNVILAGDKLLGLTQAGTLFLADADAAEFRLRGTLPGVLTGPRAWALPALVDGRLYLRDDEKVACYDVR